MSRKDFKRKCLRAWINKAAKLEKLQTIIKENDGIKVVDANIHHNRIKIEHVYSITKVDNKYIIKFNNKQIIKHKNNLIPGRKQPRACKGKNPYDEDGEYMFNPKKEI